MKDLVVYSSFPSPLGTLWVCATESGVCSLSLSPRSRKDFFRKINRRFEGPPVRDERRIRPIAREVKNLLGERSRQLSIPVDLRGMTDFQSRVQRAQQEISYSQVRSYAWVAQHIGNPKAYRAVGKVCAANPVPLLVPCHRVIAKDGSICGFRGGPKIKRWLLDLESGKG
jgi:O-6-methylguanine DNA methyltransferase